MLYSFKFLVFIPIVLSSTIPLLCVITLATVIGFGTYIKFRYSSKRLKNKGKLNGIIRVLIFLNNTVESPETDLSRNEAYERANIVISMKRNDAYESVLKSKL